MAKTIGEVYEERIKEEAKAFCEKQLADMRMFMKPSEYQDTMIELMDVFIAGANSARNVIAELIKEQHK